MRLYWKMEGKTFPRRGPVLRLAEEFGRISMLPRQSQAHFGGGDGGQEGSSKHSVQHVIRVIVVGGRDELGTGQSLVGMADGELFLRRTRVPCQGKRKDEER